MEDDEFYTKNVAPEHECYLSILLLMWMLLHSNDRENQAHLTTEKTEDEKASDAS